MKRNIREYFQELFSSKGSYVSDKLLKGIGNSILAYNNKMLTKEYTGIEISKPLKSMVPTKASGDDGFSALCYQHFWHIVGLEITAFCLKILNDEIALDDINSTNIMLLLKVPNLVSIKSFKPISLCNVLYKLVVKTIANRFQFVLDR